MNTEKTVQDEQLENEPTLGELAGDPEEETSDDGDDEDLDGDEEDDDFGEHD